jgi:hypothetical protein
MWEIEVETFQKNIFLTLNMEVKWLMQHEANHSPPSMLKLKMHGIIPPLSNMPSQCSTYLSTGCLHDMVLS